MKITGVGKGRRYMSAGLLALALLLSGSTGAQDREKFDSIAARYKNEHAVYTKMHEQLVITAEDGELEAQSYVTLEKLFISDLSLNAYNMDLFWYGYFHRPASYSGNAYLPVSQKKYKQVACETFVSGAPHSYVFYDDTRIGGAYYTGLRKNTVTETRYSLSHTDIRMLPAFEFQDLYKGLPVAEATLEVVAPDYVKMNFVLKGENTGRIKQTKEEKDGKIYYRFTATNMPALKHFDDVPSWRYYVPHVIPYITSYRITGAKKDSVLANSPDDLYKYLYNYVRGKNIKTGKELAATVEQITKDDRTDREKAAHIYKWVQDNIHYIAIENGLEGFVPRPADTVYKRKYGDCKDMSSIIMAMCRKAGLNAYFVWVGSDNLPYSNKETPLSCLFDHMICAVKLDNEWVFMDGTSAYMPFGHNRQDLQGKEATIAIDEKNYEIVTIPVAPADKNIVIDSTYLTLDGKKITGSVSRAYKGYDAWHIGQWLAMNRDKEEKRRMMKRLTERGTDRYELVKYAVNTANNNDKDLLINADFEVDNYVRYAGKECIVNMNVLRNGQDRIDTKDRVAASYHDHKEKQKEVVVLAIPKGYKVKYLPKATKGALGDLWNYSVSYKADKKSITLTKTYERNTLAIGTDKFAENNKMADELKKVYKESVVLTTN